MLYVNEKDLDKYDVLFSVENALKSAIQIIG